MPTPTKNLLGTILTIGGIALVVYGITVFGQSEESASVLGLHISVKDRDLQMRSFVLIGLGLIPLVGGLFVMGKK